MSALKNNIILIILSLFITSCMPDSLTKFKEESVEKEQAQEIDTDVTFKDEEGNVISSTELVPPVSFSYTDKVFEVGVSDILATNSSALNDLAPLGPSELTENMYENYLPRYTVIPGLPTGLVINPKTGYISGSLASPFVPTTYTVTLTYRSPTTFTDTSIATSVSIGAEIKVPSDFRVSFGSSVTDKRMGLKLADNERFKIAGITKVSSLTGAQGDILSTDDSNSVYVDVTSATDFKIGDLVDNSTSYVSQESTIEEVVFYFETSESTPNIELTPLASSMDSLDNATNGVTFEISPDLPTGLSLSATTGVISGFVTEAQEKTSYTYTVKNNSSTQSFNLQLAIIDSPKLLSYSNLKVFEISDATAFKVGNNITSSPLPPSTQYGAGIVRYVIDGAQDYLVVEITESNGFEESQAIDNSSTFFATEATIIDTPEPLTSIIEVASSAGFSDYNNVAIGNPSHIICQTDNASALEHGKAVVTKIVGNRLFVMQSKGIASGEYPGVFRDTGAYSVLNTAGCDALNIGTNTSSVVQKVWSPSIKATVNSVAAFIKGLDIISNTKASGYVSKISGLDLELKVNSQVEFDNGQTLDADKPYTVADATVASVSTHMKFELERGVETNIQPFLVKGDELVFSISPELPEGLNINQSTGAITGVPTKATSESTHQITATNVIGSQTVAITIHVQDYFTIADGGNSASSYIMHKTGEGNSFSQCKINKDDIDTYNLTLADSRPVDISCILDGGELDIYELGVKFKADSGPSVCQFIEYQPFSFMRYKPTRTTSLNVFAVVDSSSCNATSITAGTLFLDSHLAVADIDDGDDSDFRGANNPILYTEAELCQALYEGGSINCDTGSVRLRTYSIGNDENDAGGDGLDDLECSYSETGFRDVACGGQIRSCLDGPIKEVLDDTAIVSGKDSVTIESNSGGINEFTISSPRSLGHATNKYVVNEFSNYQCSSAGTPTQYSYDFDGLLAYAENFSATTIIDPLKGANPYYTFYCLNSAKDIKARIRVVVREWDKDFKQEDNIDSFLPVGGLIDNATTILGKPVNSYNDWTDGGTGHTPSYTACSAAGTYTDGAQAVTGTVEGDILTKTVRGTGTFFTEELGVGNTITIGGTPYTIKQIIDDEELLVNEVITVAFAAAAMTKRSIKHFPGDDL